MKWIPVFLCSAALCSAAEFVNGQAARFVIGQRTFTAQAEGAAANRLGGVSGIAVAGDTLFAVDSNRVGADPQNNRVLVFGNLSQQVPRPEQAINSRPDDRCAVCRGTADLVLGQPGFGNDDNPNNKINVTGEVRPNQRGLRQPNAVASDGVRLAVADTDNNRVLIWNSLPTDTGQNADLVLGQENFTSNRGPSSPSASTLRGPQGVWIQDDRLYVADTANHRVLIWRSFPTRNGQPADVVLGQADMTRAEVSERNVGNDPVTGLPIFRASPTAANLLFPVSVSSDGQRLFVTDLGHNRIAIWNSIPNANSQSADVFVGQPNPQEYQANNSPKLCASAGKDSNNNDLFPFRCGATLSFPRYALSDGQRLYVADSGNDRVLVFNTVPTGNGTAADVVLGQPSLTLNQVSDGANFGRNSAADALRTPMSLAWRNGDLYVSDPFNRRVVVYSPGETLIAPAGVRNAASILIFANGTVAFGGTAKEGDEVTLRIGSREYKYKLVANDTFDKVVTELSTRINADGGDPLVFAQPNLALDTILLAARQAGEEGNVVTISVTVAGVNATTAPQLQAAASGARLTGGADSARIAPGSLITILGENFSGRTEAAPADADPLPVTLADTQVYVDGIPIPLLRVEPNRIQAQMPFEVLDSTSVSVYVRTVRPSGAVASVPLAVPIITENPGVFAEAGDEPRVAQVYHANSNAAGTVSVDGTVKTGDRAVIKIDDREYTYTAVDGDTNVTVRDNLINQINENDPAVSARAGTGFPRVRLSARVAGPDGNGLGFSARAEVSSGTGTPGLIMTAYGDRLCCASVAGAPVTPENPAVPGEVVFVYATGLGIVNPRDVSLSLTTGYRYAGPEDNQPNQFVDATAGGRTAQVLAAYLVPGRVGIYRVDLELSNALPTDPLTPLRVNQGFSLGNTVTFPVQAPEPE